MNLSDHEFVVVDGNIRFGLDAVKGVGYAAVEAIKAARRRRPVRVDLGLLCARRRSGGEQEGDRGAREVRRVRLDRRGRKGMLAVLGRRRPRRRPSRTPRSARAPSSTGSSTTQPPAARDGGVRRAPASTDPAEEFDQPELLAIEKESIGLFISAHPLKQVREALRAKVDCSLGELAERKDGDWVTAGGIITQAKKIRTRNGDR